MKRQQKILFIFTLFCFLSFGCSQAKDKLLAPDFTLQDLNGNSVTLSGYKDKSALILFFWTTWCPFCRTELKDLNAKKEQLVKEGWELIAIDIGEPKNKVAAYMKNFAPSLTVLLDSDSGVAQSYQLVGVPTFVIIDKQGNAVFKDNYFPNQEFRSSVLK